jgi:NAD(P)-dependent dehydrogenase (short-subunit alcohol dehydrogenase family)
MLKSIEGRSVIVTGASRGIGKGIARVFAAKGAQVLVVARNSGPAETTANEIRASGGKASAFGADVSSWLEAQRIAAEAVARFGGIDILCANAGIFPAAKLGDLTPESWDEVLGTNLKGTHLFDGQSLLARHESQAQRADCLDVVNHGPDHRLPRMGPLRCEQGRPARLHAHRGHRARAVQHHHQRGDARQHQDRGP